MCYCVLSERSLRTQQQQQRRVKKIVAQIFGLLLHDVIPRSTENKGRTFLFFHNCHVCALVIVSLTFLLLSMLCQHVPTHFSANFTRDSSFKVSLGLYIEGSLFIFHWYFAFSNLNKKKEKYIN